MHRIDNTTALLTLPQPIQPGSPGYFSNGDPLTGLAPTVVEADWMNSVQEEISYVIETSGLVLNKQDRTQLFQAITRLTRLRLQGPVTFYVAPGGSDNNLGTAASPWATITHAYNWIRDRLDLNGFVATIQLADGTYGACFMQNAIVGPWVVLNGNANDPTRVVVHGQAACAIWILMGAAVMVQNLTVRADGTQGPFVNQGVGITVSHGSFYGLNNVYFDVCQNQHIWVTNSAVGGAQSNNLPFTIIGSAPIHLYATQNAMPGYYGANITLLNAPTFSTGFCVAQWGASVDLRNTIFTGTAHGKKFDVSYGAGIDTGGRGINVLPGDIAGTNNGGYYS
jgi:hypothetical protein